MKYEYTYTEEMFIDFNIVALKPMHQKTKRQWHIVLIFWLAVLVFVGIPLFTTDMYKKEVGFSFLLCAFGLLFFYRYIRAVFLWEKNARKMFKKYIQSDPHLFREEQNTIEIRDGIFYTQNTFGEKTELPCSQIYKVAESETNLFLFLTSNKAFIVPKHIFATAEEKAAFKASFQ